MRDPSARLRAFFTSPAQRFELRVASHFAGVTGVFFAYCGIALVIDAEWSRIANPFFAAAICAVVLGIGAALLYTAWQLHQNALRARSTNDA